MHLLTTEIRQKLPALYATEGIEDPIVFCKFFLPMTNFSWYPIEFDGIDTFYGYVIGQFSELGYFSLSELESVRGPFHLSVSPDLFFEPVPLSKVKGKSNQKEANASI